MAIDKNKNKQILVTFPNEMLEDINKYWHREELGSRTEAIRKLIKIGLKIEKERRSSN